METAAGRARIDSAVIDATCTGATDSVLSTPDEPRPLSVWSMNFERPYLRLVNLDSSVADY
jgi:hypothetical protein